MRLDQLISPNHDRRPERPAVIGPAETLTYAELNAAANRVARWLRAVGCQPGDRVGLYAEKSPRAVAALLGTLRAGALYVPIDPQAPAARAAHIARDCGLVSLVLSRRTAQIWAEASDGGSVWPPPMPVLSCEGRGPVGGVTETAVPWDDLQALPAGPLAEFPQAEAAYILYTSGSTGQPKGVVLSHTNALTFVEWSACLIDLTPDDRVISLAPLHFDLSVFDLYASFLRGAAVVLADEHWTLAPHRLVEWLHEQAVSIIYSTPSTFLLLQQTGQFHAARLPRLRTVIFAGEVFPLPELRRLMAAFPAARFYNFFGPTETNVCLYHPLDEPPAATAREVPIGRPCAGARMSIRDENGAEVADGDVGQLFVDGPTVLLGYWEGGEVRPTPRPYATGDLVVRRPDGMFLFRGRRDHQVKLRGMRIELGEVEAVLHRDPRVRQAVACVARQRLTAVVVAKDPGLSVLAVKRHCAKHLPAGMVPQDVLLVECLPHTSSGKVDRQGIAALTAAATIHCADETLEGKDDP